MKQLLYLFGIIFTVALTSCADPCADTICYNGGICIDGTCDCPQGYIGSDCDIELSSDGEVVFWNYFGDFLGIVDVTVNGQTKAITSDWGSTSPPDCNECSGCAHFSLPAGTHSYTARERGSGGTNWTGYTFTVSSNGCSTVRLSD